MRNKVINVIKYGITAIAIINLILMFGFNYRIMGIDFLEYVRGNQNQIQYVSSFAETAATAETAEEIEEKESEPEPEKKTKKSGTKVPGFYFVRPSLCCSIILSKIGRRDANTSSGLIRIPSGLISSTTVHFLGSRAATDLYTSETSVNNFKSLSWISGLPFWYAFNPWLRMEYDISAGKYK